MLAREDGQTIVEYALVIGIISVAMIIAFVGSGILDDFADLVSQLGPFFSD